MAKIILNTVFSSPKTPVYQIQAKKNDKIEISISLTIFNFQSDCTKIFCYDSRILKGTVELVVDRATI